MMTGLAFSDGQAGMHLMLEGDGAKLRVEMDDLLFIRNSQLV